MLGPLMDALGYVGSALDKPGAAVRGALAGRPGQLLNLVPFSDAAGLTREEDRVSGRDLLQHFGALDEGDDSLLGGALGAGVDALSNPLTYGGGGALLKALGMARGSSTPALLASRRGMAFAKGVDESGKAGRVVGPRIEGMNAFPLRSNAREVAEWLGEGIPQGAQALYAPGMNAGAVARGVGPGAVRHEVVHGLIDQAARGGGEGMPLAIRLAAKLRGQVQPRVPPSGARQALGAFVDELAAHGLENRGALEQLQGAGKFLFGDFPGREAYAQIFGNASPLVGSAYRHLPLLPPVAALGAAGSAAVGIPLAVKYSGGE